MSPFLKNRVFWIHVLVVFGIQLGLLLIWATPLYEIDTNSFVRGGFSWDIFHNPFLNLYLAVTGKIWANVWFILSGQLLFFAFAVTFLAHVLFRNQTLLLWFALLLAVLEPVTMYYNFALLAESFYASFILLGVAFLILWFREGRLMYAILFGAALGGAFLCKLSGMIHLPLFVLLFFRRRSPLPARLISMAGAVVPFMLCYLFVLGGQKVINNGGLYTVEGRVRWDFSSSQYRPQEIAGDQFHQYVDPYIIKKGALVSHRELRRELSYLGYKDCLADLERQGTDPNAAILECDRIFGDVAAQIMDQHFWEAEMQFIKDNFRFVHSLNYLDYRFTPGLHYYYPAYEFAYIDSLMQATYDYSLENRSRDIPAIWRSLDFGNVYMPLMWWLWALLLVALGLLFLQKMSRYELAVMGVPLGITLVFHLVYISYRPRFLAPYLILMLFCLLCVIGHFLRIRSLEQG